MWSRSARLFFTPFPSSFTWWGWQLEEGGRELLCSDAQSHSNHFLLKVQEPLVFFAVKTRLSVSNKILQKWKNYAFGSGTNVCWFDQTKQSFSLLFLILHITLVPFSNAVSGMRCSRELFCYRLRPEETSSALWPEEGFAFQIHCKSQIQVRTEKKNANNCLPEIKIIFLKKPSQTSPQSFLPEAETKSCRSLIFWFLGRHQAVWWGASHFFVKVYWVSQWLGLRFEGWAGLGCSFPSQLCLLCSPTMEPEADGERWH